MLIKQKIEAISLLCKEYEVNQLEVFGSASRGVDFDPKTSDADFLIKFNENTRRRPLHAFFDFRDALSKLLDRSVDLVDYDMVENPYIKASINRSRELIYGT